MIGLYEYTNQLKESYDILLDRPDLLQSDYVLKFIKSAPTINSVI